ncbi:MAG: PKD domain-containing protein, partial [Methylotetracoccus sp.]|nr:PKD domain-containing protein [Methylotetracoccus sp.]
MVPTAAQSAGLLLTLWLSGVLAGSAQPSERGHLVPVPSRVDLQWTPLWLNRSSGLYEGGVDEKGRPYVDLPLINGALRPGERVAAVLVQFRVSAAPSPKPSPALNFKYKLYASLAAWNHPPVADAGPDQTAPVGATVTLDGSGSTDRDGDRLSYRWTLRQRPESSQAVLSGADTLHPAFSIDRAGRYEVALVVSDGNADSPADTVVVSTVNSKPVAHAGPDQSVFVGSRVQLDGSASTDADGDALVYGWALKAKPAQSLAELWQAGTATPGFDVDQPGRYEVELTVEDGQAASDPDTVVVDTENSRPVADAGPPQTATVGAEVHLDGRASTDADGDALDFAWSLLAMPNGSQAELADPLRPVSRLIPDVPGSYVAQLIVNDGQLASAPDTAEVTVSAPPNRAPTITSSPPLRATVDQDYDYAVAANDPDGDTLRYALQVSPSGLVIDPLSGVIRWRPLASQIGTAAVQVTADDGRGGTAVQRFELIVQPDASRTVVPAVTGLLRPLAELAILDAGMQWGGIRFETNPLAEGTVLAQDPAAGGVVLRGTALQLVVSLGPESLLPPHPPTVAPRIDATTPTTTAAATEFLFSGAHPIQTGVAAGVMAPVRTAVLRGRVLDRNQAPLPGVAVTIKDHPEFGRTLTRADGAFDLAVNGGGVLILNFTKDGYLPAQRPADPGWQEYTVLEEVLLLPLDARSTLIEAGPDAPPQAAQGSVVTDQDGTRQVTALFPAGVQAAMTLPDGTVQSLSTLTVRATEYTVGEKGPQSMPGLLPASSGYTYAVELSADEALAAGAETLRFDRPVPVYVDNFLGFPVGMAVPAGYYDRSKAAWMPSDNGQVIKLLGITDQWADLDVDGDGVADDARTLSVVGVTDAERQQLAQRFEPGASFWRVPVTHFTPWDFNWPYGPPADAKAPLQPAPRSEQGLDDPDCQSGSIIECQTQTLGEVLPMAGTSLALHYRSDRTAGRQTAYVLDIPLSGASVPASLKRIELDIQIAGQRHTQTFPAAANQTTRFTWDGLDGYGRKVSGVQAATVRIGYTYDAVYQTPAALRSAFGAYSGVPITGRRARNELTLWQTHQTEIGSWSALPLGFGGWSLNVHHV